MDTITLPFRFVPDGAAMPDLSDFRDPIILRARFEPAPQPPPEPETTTTPTPLTDVAPEPREDGRLQPFYPEAWLLGGVGLGRLGLHALIALGRQVLRPGTQIGQARPTEPAVTPNGAQATRRAVEPEAVPLIHITPRQAQRKFHHAKDFGVEGNWNPRNSERFAEIVREFVKKSDVTRINARYRGRSVEIYFQPSTSRAVITDPKGNFISGWRLGDNQILGLLRDQVLR